MVKNDIKTSKNVKNCKKIAKKLPKRVVSLDSNGNEIDPKTLEKSRKTAQENAKWQALKDKLSKPIIDCTKYYKEMFENNLSKLSAYEVSTDSNGNRVNIGDKVAFSDNVTFDDMGDTLGSTLQSTSGISYSIISKFNQVFIGWQNCAILQQNGLMDKICSLPATDAMSAGYKLSYSSNKGEADEEKLENWVKDSNEKKYEIDKACMQAVRNKKVFGYALVIPTFSSDVDMSKPFDISKIKKGIYTGLKVVDPYWVTYDFDQRSLTDTTYKHYYEPTWYRFSTGRNNEVSTAIHRSWCIKLINAEVSDILKPAYFFGGVPKTQQIYEALYGSEKALNEAMQLLLTKRTFVAEAEIANLVANENEVTAKLDAIAMLHNNYAIFVKDIGTEVTQLDTTLTGLKEVIESMWQRVAAIAEIPVEKLLNAPTKGFNSTGKFEDKDYKEHLLRVQKWDMKPILDYHYKLYTHSMSKSSIPLEVTFNPVDTPDQKTIAEIRDLTIKSILQLVVGKIISKEEARDLLRNNPNLNMSTLPSEIPEIDDDQNVDVFGVEKDNQGRPLPKSKDDPIRGKTKEDIK